MEAPVNNIENESMFEQKIPTETERKYLPVYPGRLLHFLNNAETIHQYYLSHPSEPFSLRLRESKTLGQETNHVATLKSRGETTAHGLERLEVETPIDEQVFNYYRSMGLPRIVKRRATPVEGVAIDFFADKYTQCESENDTAWQAFTESARTDFVDITGDKITDNEWRAHLDYRRDHNGREGLVPTEPLDIDSMVETINDRLADTDSLVVRVAGRSGSGKTTIINSLIDRLEGQGIGTTTLSTDDYHRGKTWLEKYKGGEWTEWDAPIVYDVETLAADIDRLTDGKPIQKRWFDFQTEEPVFGEAIHPQQVIIIEGIYAKSRMLDKVGDLTYEMPTPLATCIGRRIMRDLCERPQFANPEKSLRYILEQAEPAYRAQA